MTPAQYTRIVVYLYDLGLRFTDEPMPSVVMPYAARRPEWSSHREELGLPQPRAWRRTEQGWVEVS